MERTARIHEHELELRLVPGNDVCTYKFTWTDWRRRDGVGTSESADRLRSPVLHRRAANGRLLDSLGHAVFVEKSRADWSSAACAR